MATPKNVHIKYDNSLRNVIFDTFAHRKSWSVVLSYLNEYGTIIGKGQRCANVNKLSFEHFDGDENEFQKLVHERCVFVVVANETYNVITWGALDGTHDVNDDDPRWQTHFFNLVQIGRNSGRVVNATRNPLKFARKIKDALVGEVYVAKGDVEEGIKHAAHYDAKLNDSYRYKWHRSKWDCGKWGRDKSGYSSNDHFNVRDKLFEYKANKHRTFVVNKLEYLFGRAMEIIENSRTLDVKIKRFGKLAYEVHYFGYDDGEHCFNYGFDLWNLKRKGLSEIDNETINWLYETFTSKKPNLVESIISELQMID